MKERISGVNYASAQGTQKVLLDQVNSAFGKVPNLTATMAVAPAVLEGFLGFSGGLGKTTLSMGVREQIAIAVSQYNECEYCLSAHTTIAGMAGVSEADRDAARDARASDPMVQAALQLAINVVTTKGHLSDEQFEAARSGGLSDEQILEVTAVAAHTILTNYLNHVAGTPNDWPVVPVQRTVGV